MLCDIPEIRAVILARRQQYHIREGGYGHLRNYLTGQVISCKKFTTPLTKYIDRVWDVTLKQAPSLLDYHLSDRIAEEKVFWYSTFHRPNIIHALYGDDQLDILLKRLRFISGHLVATFHLPIDKTKDRFEGDRKILLQRLSGAVVVASSEVPALATYLGKDKVMFVPHAVDTTSIKPGPGNRDETLRLVFVGMHMRDFDVAHRVIDRCAQEKLNVVFDVVLPESRHSFFTGCDNVRRHSGIPDEALIALYQNSDALFLPLTGATANNAVLESLGCGTPVISTDIGGIPDYVDARCGWLLPPGDAEAAFRCIKTICENRDLAWSKRRAVRERAEELSFERTASLIEAGYRRLLSGGTFSGVA